MIRKLVLTLMLAAACAATTAVAQQPAGAPADPASPAAPTPSAAPAPAPAPAPAASPAVPATPGAPAAPTAAPVAGATPAAAAPADAAAAASSDEPVTAASKAPVFEEGNVAWMMTSTALVLLMSLPGLALFYGGMVRSKNMLSTLTQTFAIFCVIGVLWVVYGYSVAFSDGNPYFGGFSKVMLEGVVYDANGFFAATGTFSKGVAIPELVFAVFQMTFACITVALIAGAYAERMKFKAVMIFSIVWFTFSYLPMAHMVWWWAGPDAYTSMDKVDAVNATAGKLWQLGALDFAGGTVVHINAGVAGLVCAIVLGKRSGLGTAAMAPHSLVMSMIGASLLWFGWFGFNAGSNLEANGYAVLAFANTLFATAAAAVAWFFAEWILKGKPSLLGIISGAVAGLVAITPACGYVGISGGMIIGALAGLICFLSVAYLKRLIGYDDALDAFGVHAIGGILGAILTGVFVDPGKGGVGVYNNWVEMVPGYSSGQIMIQVKAVAVAIVLSGVVSLVTMLLLKFTIGVRVSEEAESEGLDIAEHGERAYH